jgi:hypothetical protein
MSNARFERFVPITKVNEETREVHGILALEQPDHAGEIMDYEKSKPFIQEWSDSFKLATGGKSAGNLRAMHGNVCAGKFTAVEFNDADKSVPVVAKVVDEQEWAKVVEGCYTGFSIGGSYGDVWMDGKLKRYIAKPVEGSLADKPCMPGATFTLIRADGSVELRKFVAAPPAPTEAVAKWLDGSLRKALEAAVAAGDSAIESIKAMAVQMLGEAGKPDTWSIEDLMQAIRRVAGAQYSAASAGGGLSMSTQPEVTKTAPVAGAPAATADPAPPAPATAPAGDVHILKQITDTLGALHKALTDQAGEQKAAREELGKVVEAATAAATSSILEKAGAQLAEVQKSLEERIGKIEAQPARPGVPVDKTVGVTGAHPLAAEFGKLEALIQTLEKSGADSATIRDVRMAASQLALAPLR